MEWKSARSLQRLTHYIQALVVGLVFLGNRIKIVKAKEINYKGNPGKIVDKNFTIACLKNAVQI